MLKKLGIADIILPVLKQIREKTGIETYDIPPSNKESPLYYVELYGKTNSDTKTMYRETFSLAIHCIAEPEVGNTKGYELIQQLEEALSERIVLPEYVELINQFSNGLLSIKKDETDETHAICVFNFIVSYGFKTKN